MYARSIGLLALAALVVTYDIGAEAEVVLVENGRPRATIVIADAPTKQAREAAAELQRYIQQISGARMPISRMGEHVEGPRILVGRSAAVDALGVVIPSGHTYQMNEEGYVVKTVNDTLVLAGNEDWQYLGTTYAVYDFLDSLGCRWFFPHDYGEVIPKLKIIAVSDVDRVERPSFRFRNIWYAGWMPISKEDREALKLWYNRNRLTSFKMSMPGDGSVVNIAPPEKYFASNPEIYALDTDGSRMKDMVCMSEPKTVEIAVKTITEGFRSDPEALTFGFAPPDGFPMCFCQNCRNASPGFQGKGYGEPSLSDVWFQFANKVAMEVYKEFPERWLFTNGYANRVQPPEGVGPFSPNLGIQSAIISACVLHPIGDPKCWQRVTYKQVLDRWSRDLDCVFIYDYDPGKAIENLPHPNLHNLKHDMPYFRDRGIWGFWTEGSNVWLSTHLNYYVRAKMMWSADADVDALVHDYCQKFYGPAADAIEKYIWTLENAVGDSDVHANWGRITPWPEILPTVLDALDASIAGAESLARRAPEKRRVQMLRYAHEHMRAYLDMEEAAANADFRAAVRYADKMIEIRSTVSALEPGMLPHTPEWARTFRTSLEWFRSLYEGFANKAGGEEGELVTLLPREWEFTQDPEDMGVIYQWYLPENTREWTPIDTTNYWEAQGYQDDKGWGYWGKAWYQVDVDVPANAAGKPLWLTIGAVYNRGVWIWVNGRLQQWEMNRHYRLGHHDEHTPIHIEVTDSIKPGESNHIAVLVNTVMPDRNPRGGIYRRAFLWTPKRPLDQIFPPKEEAGD